MRPADRGCDPAVRRHHCRECSCVDVGNRDQRGEPARADGDEAAGQDDDRIRDGEGVAQPADATGMNCWPIRRWRRRVSPLILASLSTRSRRQLSDCTGISATQGVVVVGVNPASEAASVGVGVGDVIVKVQDAPVATPPDGVVRRLLGAAEDAARNRDASGDAKVHIAAMDRGVYGEFDQSGRNGGDGGVAAVIPRSAGRN